MPLGERETALAVARMLIPGGERLPGADERTLAAVEELVGAPAARVVGGLCSTLDRAALLSHGRRLVRLGPGEREALLRRWERDPVLRFPLFGLGALLKSVHFDQPAVHELMGSAYEKGGPAEPQAWLRQVECLDDAETDETIECDAVVMGTGAGGAVVGTELAKRGHAVVFLEEGRFHRRDAFHGRAFESHRKFYRHGGLTSVGNTAMPVLMGRLVGGSTAINTGTCWRTPEWVLDEWCERLGTDDLSPENMAPYFARVEQTLHVEPAGDHLGGLARVVARGCDELGWRHYPILRNAPDCDGQGVCDMGCPSGARRSTEVSYLPEALKRGAVLYTRARATSVVIEGGRAVGLDAVSADGRRRLRVRASAVVLAGGSVPTVLFLLAQGIANSSGQIGRNLSLHPCTVLSALFDEKIDGYNSIPQGYVCDEFHREDLLLMGAQSPLGIGSAMFLPFGGRRLSEAMERFDRIASLMVQIRDESRGRVRRRRSGHALITYVMSDRDARLLQRGLVRVAELFRAAGATTLYPMIPALPVLEGPGAIEQLRAFPLKPRHPLLTSFHPIGTCRIGRDPKTSVVGLDHQTHDVPGLFIADGSTVPGPPGVNPQVTIMAMATRAARSIDAVLAQ